MTCIIVLGCHRSGTSAVAGVLHHLGVNMGQTLLGPSDGNPKGHYEDKVLLDLLDKAIGDWKKPTPDFEQVRFRYSEAIREREKQMLWGMKDPRLCYFLPDVLDAIHCQVKVVDVRRSTACVVASLMVRDGMSEQETHDLALEWLAAKKRALGHFVGQVHEVHYDDLVDQPQREVGRLAAFVGLPVNEQALAFVDPTLRHHA